MDFYSLKEYTISDVEQLIQDEVEENIHLDYKRDGALSKEDNRKRTEITKDVSAFANSDGGIIVYGLAESDHKPQSITYIDGMVYTKEWLENIINSIQPRIDGVKIYPVRKDNDLKQSLYIVKIPRSSKAPHMAKDKRYYKRLNFLSEPMEDYEVKDVMYRHHSPKLTLINGSLQPDDERTPYSETVRYSFKAWIKNEGKKFCKDYKISAYFFDFPSETTRSYNPAEGMVLPMLISNFCFRITSPCKETIFPNEIIETGHYLLEIPIKEINKLNHAYIKLTLLYEDGGREDLLIGALENSELYIDEPEEIREYILKDHPDFNIIDNL